MTIRNSAGRMALILTLLAFAPITVSAREEGGAKLSVTLEATRPFIYEGEPLILRIGVFNTGDKPYDNKDRIDLAGGLQVLDGDMAPVPATKKHKVSTKEQPEIIGAGGFFGTFYDIRHTRPAMEKAGTYTISLRLVELSAGPVTVKVLPPFEPDADYVAVFETDFGFLEFDLLTESAPKHVQNFYDLSLQGFYDNTVLFKIIKGVELRGGDPTGSGDGWPGYALEPELSPELKHVRGTLSAVRLPGRNRDNGSQFVITLGPNTNYDGALSVFGQLEEGEDVLKAVENIPTTGQMEPPHYRPLKPVTLRIVRVKKAPAQ